MADERYHRWLAKVQACLGIGVFILGFVHSTSGRQWGLSMRFFVDVLTELILFVVFLYLIGCAVSHGRKAKELAGRRFGGSR